jgi:tetratricopeptide (TPR) repeat protein
MDQMISAAGVAGHALLIDCRSLATMPMPLPAGTAVVVLDTATRRGLVDSAYNERRAQCEAAARHFGVVALRDVSVAQLEPAKPDLDALTYRRARHVVTENDRVMQACDAMRAGDRVGEGASLGNLGRAYADLGDARRASGYYEQALAIDREIGDLNGVATRSFNMALLYAQQGDQARALPLAREADRLWGQTGHAEYAQRAQQLVVQLEGGSSGAGPTPAEILGQFAPIIEAAITMTQGNRSARAQLEDAFPTLTQKGWQIADPIRRIQAGERDEVALTAGLDANSALIVREILRRL